MSSALGSPVLFLLCSAVFAAPTTPSGQSCGKSYFQCENGPCILESSRCDGYRDCPLGEDEGDCHENRICTADEFHCGSQAQKCIPNAWKCDGENDCLDGTDEQQCTEGGCSDNEFQCANTYNAVPTCIIDIWVCDGDRDCPDGSDELNCTHSKTCSTKNTFPCPYGDKIICLPISSKCDGKRDCYMEDDEADCPYKARNRTCSPHQFKCDDQTCIPEVLKCDGSKDCFDGTDEQHCTSDTKEEERCYDNQFKCDSSGYCIPLTRACDGFSDCPDRSDERYCISNTMAMHCNPETEFHCGKGICIPSQLRCDGAIDCTSRMDELNCSTRQIASETTGTTPTAWECSLNNGGCQHICLSEEQICECNPGFSLQPDGFSCTDLDECSQTPSVCSQKCLNIPGSYACGCFDNYYLLRDMHHCKAAWNEEARLLVAADNSVKSVNVENPSDTVSYNLIPKPSSSISMDYSYMNNTLFVGDVIAEQIHKCVNFSSCSVLVEDRVRVVDGMALDWIHGLLYWTDTGLNTISVLSLGNEKRKTLINDYLDEPRAIAVDPELGLIFWTDWWKTPKIERATSDGLERKVLVDQQIRWPNGLTLDYPGKQIFWIDGREKAIFSMAYDGSNRQTVFKQSSTISQPFSLALFEDFLYWSDWGSNDVHFVSKLNRNQTGSFGKSWNRLMAVKIYHEIAQPDYPNVCIHSSCEEICFPKGSLGFVCGCEDGKIIADDEKSCLDNNVLNSWT